jgi:hypothetical protein
MFATTLGDDDAELRPLEPWHAAEFLAHINRAREFIGQYIPLPDNCFGPFPDERHRTKLAGQWIRLPPMIAA